MGAGNRNHAIARSVDSTTNLLAHEFCCPVLQMPRPGLPPTTSYLPDPSGSNSSPWSTQRVSRRASNSEKAALSRTDNAVAEKISLISKRAIQKDESYSGRCNTAPESPYRDSPQQQRMPLDSNREKMVLYQQSPAPSGSRSDSLCGDLRGRLANSATVNLMFANKMTSKMISPSDSMMVSTATGTCHPEFINDSP